MLASQVPKFPSGSGNLTRCLPPPPAAFYIVTDNKTNYKLRVIQVTKDSYSFAKNMSQFQFWEVLQGVVASPCLPAGLGSCPNFE